MKTLPGLLIAVLVSSQSIPLLAQQPRAWKMHDMSRSRPPVVEVASQDVQVPPPADAVVLFDGNDLLRWTKSDGGKAEWTLGDGYFATVAGSGSIQTKEAFGDVQLHIEWATPSTVKGDGQGRGNSGVFLMGLYEVQVLDSYENETYADGQAAAIYGQYPPLYNVSRPPGEWQRYDIFFRRPRFDAAGALVTPARMTVVHNGVLVHDNVELLGPTSWLSNAPYKAHPDRLPVSLQDHSNPVRFRNIWARHLAPEPEPVMRTPAASLLSIPASLLDRYAGTYESKDRFRVVVSRDGDRMFANIGSDQILLDARSARDFPFAVVDGGIEFALDDKGMPTGCTFRTGGNPTSLSRISKLRTDSLRALSRSGGILP